MVKTGGEIHRRWPCPSAAQLRAGASTLRLAPVEVKIESAIEPYRRVNAPRTGLYHMAECWVCERHKRLEIDENEVVVENGGYRPIPVSDESQPVDGRYVILG